MNLGKENETAEFKKSTSDLKEGVIFLSSIRQGAPLFRGQERRRGHRAVDGRGSREEDLGSDLLIW